MVVPIEVRKWSGHLSSNEINQVASYLELIIDFKDIESDGYLVDALIQLWNPNCSTFRIGNKEMTLTIEEVASLLNLSVNGTRMKFSVTSNRTEFCHFIGLNESIMQGSDQTIDVKFLFDRFAMKDGFDKHSKDFSFASKATWERKRLLVYGLVMTEIYLFPKKDKKLVSESLKFCVIYFFGLRIDKTP